MTRNIYINFTYKWNFWIFVFSDWLFCRQNYPIHTYIKENRNPLLNKLLTCWNIILLIFRVLYCTIAKVIIISTLLISSCCYMCCIDFPQWCFHSISTQGTHNVLMEQDLYLLSCFFMMTIFFFINFNVLTMTACAAHLLSYL